MKTKTTGYVGQAARPPGQGPANACALRLTPMGSRRNRLRIDSDTRQTRLRLVRDSKYRLRLPSAWQTGVFHLLFAICYLLFRGELQASLGCLGVYARCLRDSA
jgi:hypothetical protein